MKLQQIESNNILKIGYDVPKQKLGIVFKHDEHTLYVYHKVPPNVWRAFERASSKGVFHAENIKNKFGFTKEHTSHTKD